MKKKRQKMWKKYIKHLTKLIENWTEMWDWLENIRLPISRSYVKDYKKELNDIKVIPEFLSEYYGLLVEAEYLFKEEEDESTKEAT